MQLFLFEKQGLHASSGDVEIKLILHMSQQNPVIMHFGREKEVKVTVSLGIPNCQGL